MSLNAGVEQYVILTVARNEELFLPRVAECVVRQSAIPSCWVIIDDCSTDSSWSVIQKLAREIPFVVPLRVQEYGPRSFARKARGFSLGLNWLLHAGKSWIAIANLDADVLVPHVYYQTLLQHLEMDRQLGIVSGVCWERRGGTFRCVTITREHTVGAVQLFRRECFEQIGGYKPVSVAGVDTLAEMQAIRFGWRVLSFQDLPVLHLRPTGSEQFGSSLKNFYALGKSEYLLGSDPLFCLFKMARRSLTKPWLIGALVGLLGYMVPALLRCKREVDTDFVRWRWRWQRQRIRKSLRGTLFCRQSQNSGAELLRELLEYVKR